MARLVQSSPTVTRIVMLASVLVVAGCLDHEDDRVQFDEGFEVCGACNWTTTGDVEIVTTNHPGEHAARLGEGAVLRAELAIQRWVDGNVDDYGYDQGDFSDGNWIEYSTDCGGRPLLQLLPNGTDMAIFLRLHEPPGQPFERRKMMLPILPYSWVDPTPEDPYDDEEAMVTFRSLTIEAGAPCVIDNIRLMVSGGTLGY